MGFGDMYMVPYIPGILEELLVHGTKTQKDENKNGVFQPRAQAPKKTRETTYMYQFNYHVFWLSSTKVFCVMQLT